MLGDLGEVEFLRLLVIALLGALVAPLPAVLSKSAIPAAVAADANTTTAGYQFNVTFNPPQASSGAWTIYMASTQTGTITTTWPDGASPTVLNVAPGAITSQAILAKYYLLASEHGAINNRVTRISATVPISVYGCMVQAAASDCTNFIPTANLGTAYRSLYAKSEIGTQQISIIKSIAVASAKKLIITGYASPTSGEDDIRISLDRALEVKKAILKLHPGLSVSVNVSGAGTSKASACAAFANRCVVVSTI